MPKGKILGEIKRHSGLRSWMPEALDIMFTPLLSLVITVIPYIFIQ